MTSSETFDTILRDEDGSILAEMEINYIENYDRLVYRLTFPPNEHGVTYKISGVGEKDDENWQDSNLIGATFSDGEKRVSLVATQAGVWKEGNPIVIHYTYELGGSPTFSFVHVEEASKSQLLEMYDILKTFRSMFKFKQMQKGGRKKGSMSEKTRNDYKTIIRHRYSPANRLLNDEEFLKEHPEISRSKLKRAIRKSAEGELN